MVDSDDDNLENLILEYDINTDNDDISESENEKEKMEDQPAEAVEDNTAAVKKSAKVKKIRKTRAKLENENLFERNGIPLLLDLMKSKAGKESIEFNDLMIIYQTWIHKLFPGMKILQVVEKVEKLCHSKSAKINLALMRKAFQENSDFEQVKRAIFQEKTDQNLADENIESVSPEESQTMENTLSAEQISLMAERRQAALAIMEQKRLAKEANQVMLPEDITNE